MKRAKLLAVLFLVVINIKGVLAQNIPIYTQYFVSPYIYNPAYAGLEGKSSVALTYRRQWYGIEDAPVTANFIYHTPLFAGLNMGLNVTQDNYGIFKSSSALLSLSYTATLGWNHYISLGISGGGGFQNIDYTNVNNTTDPALMNLLDKNVYLDGNAGIAYHIANFNIGISLPRIFDTETFPTKTFDAGSLALVKNYIVTADYMLYFANGDFAFQPYAMYRSYEGYGSQIEGGGIFHVKNLLWVGGSYRQDFGIAGLVGIKLKGNFSFGYSYEIPAAKAPGINKTSHEVQLTLSFGKKKKRAEKYATFLASEKPVKPKKEQKVVAKKEEPKKEVEKPIEEVKPEPKLPVVKEPEPKKEEVTPVVKPPVVTEREVVTGPVKKEEPVVEQPIKAPPLPVEKPEVIDKTNKPAVVVHKGNHPFELEKGHYVVLGVFGLFKNAVGLSDKLQSQGYNTEYGYSSEKKLFYVVIHYADDAKITRKKRDELRKKKEFANAWYLLVQ